VKVLVACEFSGIVRDAFRARGHDAWSCDLLPCEGDPTWHIQGDCLPVIYERDWDLLIAHPACTYMANSGARWLFEKPGRWGQLAAAAGFFRACLEARHIPKRAVENPQPHKWAMAMIGRPFDFKAQPWWFGERQKKGLCFWVHGLPPLIPDRMVGPPPPAGSEEAKVWEAVWREPPGPNQAHNRSRTLPGVGRAMAEQWG